MELELDSGETVLKTNDNQLTGEQLLAKYALESVEKPNDSIIINKKEKMNIKDSMSFANRPITPHNVKNSLAFSRPLDTKPTSSKQSVALNGE